MSDIIGDDLVEAIRDLDPATDTAARGVDHYVQSGGDKIEKSLFGEKSKPKEEVAQLPDLTSGPLAEPAEMPSLTSADARAAKRRSMAVQAARRGRLSTILTNDDPLGG